MNRFQTFAVGVSLGMVPLMAATALAQVSRSPQGQAVLALEHLLLQARVSADPSVAKANFADEGMYMHSSGVAQTKDEYMKNVIAAPWASFIQAEQQVHVYGDAAVTHGLLTVLLGDRRTEAVRTTGIYVMQAGAWRQVSWQSSIGKFQPAPPQPGK